MPENNGSSLPAEPLEDPAATVGFDDDVQLTRVLKRVVRTAVGPRLSNVAVARIAAGLVQAVTVLRDEAATTVLTRPADLENDEIKRILDEVVTATELRDALARRDELDITTHGVGDFTDRMNDLAAIEREVQP